MLKYKTLIKLFVLNCVSARCSCAVCVCVCVCVCVSYHQPEIQEICVSKKLLIYC